MKRTLSILFLISFVATCLGQLPPYVRSPFTTNSPSTITNIVRSLSSGGATNGIQQLNGTGTNTTLVDPTVSGTLTADTVSGTNAIFDNIYGNFANATNDSGNTPLFNGTPGNGAGLTNLNPRAMTNTVTAFGAVGDNSTDDTAAFLAAFAAATSNGVVVVPFGTYRLSSTLTGLCNGVTIQGASPSYPGPSFSNEKACRLRWIAGAGIGLAGIYLPTNSDWVIKDIVLDGNNTVDNVLDIGGGGLGGAVVVEDVQITGGKVSGVYMRDYINASKFQRVNVTANYGWGIISDGASSTTWSLTDSSVRQNTIGGMLVTNGGECVTISDCTIEANGGYAVRIVGSSGGYNTSEWSFNRCWFEYNALTAPYTFEITTADGTLPKAITLNQCRFWARTDANTNGLLNIDAGENIVVRDCFFGNTAASSNSIVVGASSKGVQIINRNQSGAVTVASELKALDRDTYETTYYPNTVYAPSLWLKAKIYFQELYALYGTNFAIYDSGNGVIGNVTASNSCLMASNSLRAGANWTLLVSNKMVQVNPNATAYRAPSAPLDVRGTNSAYAAKFSGGQYGYVDGIAGWSGIYLGDGPVGATGVVGKLTFGALSAGGNSKQAASIETVVTSVAVANTADADLAFSTHSGTVVEGTEKMRITSTGNVGIGTTNPTTKLSIVGNANASGTVYANAASITNDLTVGGMATASTLNTATPAFKSLGTNNIILRCPDGGSFILRIDNAGTISTTTNNSNL